ncbi:MAG: beta strand repeat-containing protein [Opitutaceae bacterium]
MIKNSIFLVLLAGVSISQAGTIYKQDFSSSSPLSNQFGAVGDDQQKTPVGVDDSITGGSAASRATNGDYSITAKVGGDYYIFNESGDAGFKYIDGDYNFETGSISFTSGGTVYTGTIQLDCNVNSGNEFFSINSVELVEDDGNGDVYIDIDFNFFADIGGNDSLSLTVDFGVNDQSNLTIEDLIGVGGTDNITGSGVYRHMLIQTPDPVAFEAEDMTLVGFNTESQGVASGGEVIVLSGTSGSATTTVTDGGSYDFETKYFDENDGEAVYKLYLDNVLVDAWSANRDLGSATPVAANLVTHHTKNVFVTAGQTLELFAYSDGGEFCRVDEFVLNPASSAGVNTMTWNADGTTASLLLGGAEQLSGSGSSYLRIFTGYSFSTWDWINATSQSGVTELIEDDRDVGKIYFRVDEFDHHLLFRLIGFEQIPNYDKSLNVRVSLPILGDVNVIALDDQAEATVTGSNITFDWTKLYERNRFAGGAFVLYLDGADAAENNAIVNEIESLYGGSAPISDNQDLSVDEDDSVAVTLTGTDPNGDSLTYTVLTGPSNGSLSGTEPNLTYTPDPDYSGSDSFTFNVSDGTNDSIAATVLITVDPVNDPPAADAQSVTVIENDSVAITLSGSDIDGDSIVSYNVATGPSNGQLTGTAPNLSYTPNAAYVGLDSFTFTVNDGTVDSAEATVSIAVVPVGVAGVYTWTGAVDGDWSNAANWDGSGVPVDNGAGGGHNAGLSLPPGEKIVFDVATGGSATPLPTLNIPDLGGSTNPLDTPIIELKQGGSIAFTLGGREGHVWSNNKTTYANRTVFTVGDGVGAAGEVVMSLDSTVGAPNLSRHDDNINNFQVNLDGILNFTSGTVDFGSNVNRTAKITIDGGEVNFSGVILDLTAFPNAVVDFTAVGGTLTADFGGNFADIAAVQASIGNDFVAGAGIDLQAVDNTNGTFTVTAILNTAPVADAQSVSVKEDDSVAITLTGSDADGHSLTYTVVTSPSNGLLTGTVPNLTYTPTADYSGADSFTFTINDGFVDSAEVAVSITVLPEGVYTWIGGADTDWANAANWDLNGVPVDDNISSAGLTLPVGEKVVLAGSTMPTINVPNIGSQYAGSGANQNGKWSVPVMEFNRGGAVSFGFNSSHNSGMFTNIDDGSIDRQIWTVGDGVSGAGEDVTLNMTSNILLQRHGNGVHKFTVNADGTLNFSGYVDFAYNASRYATMIIDGGAVNLTGVAIDLGTNNSYVDFTSTGGSFSAAYGGPFTDATAVSNSIGTAFLNNSGGVLKVVDNGATFTVSAISPPRWTGLGGVTWDEASTINFSTNGDGTALSGVTFATAKAVLDQVAFDDVYYDTTAQAVAQTNITIAAGGVSIPSGTVRFINNSVSYVISATDATGITGTTNVSVSGAGGVTFNDANTYSGSTLIASGSQLVLADSLALQNSTVTINGTLVFDESETSDSFTMNALADSPDLVLENNASTPEPIQLTVGNNNSSMTYTGIMSGAGGLTKVGTGTLTLREALVAGSSSTFTGDTFIKEGTVIAGGTPGNGRVGLSLNSHVYLGDTSGSADVTLQFDNVSSTTYPSTINYTVQTGSSGVVRMHNNGNSSVSGDVTLGSPNSDGKGVTLAAVGGNSGWQFRFLGAIQDPSGMTPGTSGDVTIASNNIGDIYFRGANTYSGDTVIESGGKLIVDSDGGNTGTLTFYPTSNGTTNQVRGGTASGTGTVTFNSPITLDLSSANMTAGNTWQVVDDTDLGSVTYGASFGINSTLGAFTETSAGIWTVEDGAYAWTFTESSGTLSLGLTPFGTWATTAGATLDPNFNDDSDSLVNLLEFAFGTDPNVSDASSMSINGSSFTPGLPNVEVTFSPLSVKARFVRLVDHATSGISYTAQFSHDLISWDDLAGSSAVRITGTSESNAYEAVELSYPTFLSNGKKARFYRVKIDDTASGETQPE